MDILVRAGSCRGAAVLFFDRGPLGVFGEMFGVFGEMYCSVRNFVLIACTARRLHSRAAFAANRCGDCPAACSARRVRGPVAPVAFRRRLQRCAWRAVCGRLAA